jgi:hypothetical protein
MEIENLSQDIAVRKSAARPKDTISRRKQKAIVPWGSGRWQLLRRILTLSVDATEKGSSRTGSIFVISFD